MHLPFIQGRNLKSPARRMNYLCGMKNVNFFGYFAKWISQVTGQPAAFLMAASVIVCWLISGPLFKFSDTWNLTMNTGATLITFLMVFLIQNATNRNNAAMQLKLDELIRSLEGARNVFVKLEELNEDDLANLTKAYAEAARRAREARLRGYVDTSAIEVPLPDAKSPSSKKDAA
ncbi:MAG: low affinity iron permease family protein [Verrucomicrobiota bacterium]|jgi:low affinity Fe/Cu permease